MKIIVQEKCGAPTYLNGEPSTCNNTYGKCRWHKGWREKTPKGCKWAGGCTGTALEGLRYCDEHTDVMRALGERSHRYVASRLRDLQAARSAVPLATAVPARPEPNTVHHPAHYNSSSIEVIDAIEAWNLGFNLGNVVKYVVRADYKGSAVEDLRKALWYIQRELDRRNTVSR